MTTPKYAKNNAGKGYDVYLIPEPPKTKIKKRKKKKLNKK